MSIFLSISLRAFCGQISYFASGATWKGVAVAVLWRHAKTNALEPVGEGFKVRAPESSVITDLGDGAVAKHVLTGLATLNDMVKFELAPSTRPAATVCHCSHRKL